MSIFDHVAPSERIADLVLRARRLQKATGLDTVPLLIVEGRSDEPAWGSLCLLGKEQVFSAGTRSLVEQMATMIEVTPLDGCACVYVVDCDAVGKTAQLRDRHDLVVTDTCDVEADLVELGVATRVIRPFLAVDEAAGLAIETAKRIALPLSIVRRAAHRARVSMKVRNRQLRLHEIAAETQCSWAERPPSDRDAVNEVANCLSWSAEEISLVMAEIGQVDRAPTRCLMGKDILDALFGVVCRDGRGDVRGWSYEYFHRKVLGSLQPSDVTSWVVANRIRAWGAGCGCPLLLDSDDQVQSVGESYS